METECKGINDAALLNVLLTVLIMSMMGTMSVKTEGEGISELELRSAGAVLRKWQRKEDSTGSCGR